MPKSLSPKLNNINLEEYSVMIPPIKVFVNWAVVFTITRDEAFILLKLTTNNEF